MNNNNNFNIKKEFNNIESYIKFKNEFKFIEYLNSISFKILYDEKQPIEKYYSELKSFYSIESFESILPKSVKTLSISIDCLNNGVKKPDGELIDINEIQIPAIPNWIESLELTVNNLYLHFINGVFKLSQYSSITQDGFGIGSNNNPSNNAYKYIYDFMEGNATKIGKLPSSITSLSVSSNDNFRFSVVDNSNLPNIKHLRLAGEYNSVSYLGIYETLESLSFGHRFNSPISTNIFPHSLTSIEFEGCQEYTQPFESTSFPRNLKSLKFNGLLQSIIKPNSLPSSLEYFDTGVNCNYPIGGGTGISSIFKGKRMNLFPADSKLKVFKCGIILNDSYRLSPNDLSMCSNLTELHLTTYNFSLTNNLFPSSLIKLTFFSFDNGKKKLEKGTLPPNLEYFDPSPYFLQEIAIGALPTTLKYLKLVNKSALPSSISLSKGVLPQSLTKLVLDSNINIKEFEIGSINTSVEYSGSLNFIQSQNLLMSIKELRVGDIKFSNDLQFPPNLLSISFCSSSSDYDQILKILPKSITSLSFNNRIVLKTNQNLSSFINLTTLEILDNFNLLDHQFPNSIKVLKLFGDQFKNESLSSTSFPNLEELYINDNLDFLKSFKSFDKFKNLKKIYIKKSILNLILGQCDNNLIKYFEINSD